MGRQERRDTSPLAEQIAWFRAGSGTKDFTTVEPGVGMCDYRGLKKKSVTQNTTDSLAYDLDGPRSQPQREGPSSSPVRRTTSTPARDIDLSTATTLEIPPSPTALPLRQITSASPGEIRSSSLPSPARPDPRLSDPRRSPLRIRPVS